jgi:hypothetical protein
MSKQRTTFTKNQRERAKQQKKKEKAQRRAERKTETPDRPFSGDEDPDIAGIVPGPQPPIE